MTVGISRLLGETSRPALMGAVLSFLTFGTAVAQDQPTAGAAAPTEEIIVTGSRIRTNDITASAPLTVVTAEQIQKTDAITVEQFFRKLPDVDFSNGIASNDNNGGLGASEAGLKNLGPQRTLVLVDGLRFPFTDTQRSTAAVDLNNIPVSMIDHIEILKDGASSIYGADAIAGVINIITKKNFNGFESTASLGMTDKNDGDGKEYSASATLGQNFDRGNILINLSYDHRGAVPAGDRGWAIDQHPEAFDGGDGFGLSAISSRITGAVGLFTNPAGNNIQYYFPGGPGTGVLASNAGPLLGANPIYGGLAYGGGKLTPGDIAIPGYGGVFFNYLPTEYLQGSSDRKQANFSGHYDITDSITAVMDAFFTNRQSQEELNPEPLGYNVFTPKFPNGLGVAAFYQNAAGNTVANPYFPTALWTSVTGAAPTTTSILPILTRRFENGDRVYSDNINTYRFHVGLQGTFFDDDNWEFGYYYGRSDANYQVANEADLYHAEQLSGVIPCGADAANGCSIANFLKYNGLTPAQARYLVFDNTDNSEYGESVLYGSVAGALPFVPELPGGPIKGALGFEYRTENGFDHPDSVTSAGDGATYSLPTSGGYTDASIYAEIKAPILRDLPFVKKLEIDASARYDYFNTFGRALTYKAGVDYAVTDDFRLRATNSTGYRAPQIRELFGGATISAIGGANSDPCATGGAFVTSPNCLIYNHGNPANLTQVNQISDLIGGNQNLRPETSQQWTIGGVFTPTFVPNLSLTVDYYTILIRNEISSYNPSALLNDCYGGVPYVITQAAACSLITRQASGNLGLVNSINGNIADQNTSGIDITASYGFDTEMIDIPFGGHIQLNGNANYLLSDDLIGVGGSINQYAGTWGSTTTSVNSAEPRWKALLSIDYSQDNWSFNWTSRYYGGIKDSNEGSYCLNGTLGAACPKVGAGDFEGNEAAGVFYHDISFTYNLDAASITVGVDNLFDKTPPFILSGTGDVYLSDAGYDALGRFMYVKGSIKFGAGEPAPKEEAPYTPPPAQPAMPAKVTRNYMVFFDFNKSDLTPQAVAIVDQAAKNAGPAKATEIAVTGHTDTVGSDAYNMRLSQRRAESVAAQLERDGIPKSEIDIIAKGKRDLLVPTKDGVREPQNRRVTIVYDCNCSPSS